MYYSNKIRQHHYPSTVRKTSELRLSRLTSTTTTAQSAKLVEPVTLATRDTCAEEVAALVARAWMIPSVEYKGGKTRVGCRYENGGGGHRSEKKI